jgi:hypothetical protein
LTPSGTSERGGDDLTRFLVSPVTVDPHPLFDRRFYRRQIGEAHATPSFQPKRR